MLDVSGIQLNAEPLCLFSGFLGGGEEYFTHKTHGPTPVGLDLYDNEKPDHTQNGTYSTHLFAKKAVKIMAEHKKSKVNHTLTLLAYF